LKDTAKRRPPVSPADPHALTRDDLRRLAKAEKKIASADRALQAGGHREIQELERRRTARVEGQSLAARLAETSSLALSRGELVKTETVRLAAPLVDEHGARIVKRGLPVYREETHARVRIASRGGLQLAFERGDLDSAVISAERLYETGKLYRQAFETSSALTTPQRNLAPITARSPLRASAGPQDAVFAAGEILRILRADLKSAQTAVLDRVCGLDMTVAATAAALKADARTIRKRMTEGLTLAVESRRRSSPVDRAVA
jgi:hypothetical protein